ncbi:MAG: hypothetical protein CM15mP68_0610 [Pseudomonadota bacterium]|nr:MAG: hypothetical protein CM15mP68_0610 [Pseudomonadota bacterium]
MKIAAMKSRLARLNKSKVSPDVRNPVNKLHRASLEIKMDDFGQRPGRGALAAAKTGRGPVKAR